MSSKLLVREAQIPSATFACGTLVQHGRLLIIYNSQKVGGAAGINGVARKKNQSD